MIVLLVYQFSLCLESLFMLTLRSQLQKLRLFLSIAKIGLLCSFLDTNIPKANYKMYAIYERIDIRL